MANYNKIILVGNVTKNPEVKTIANSDNLVARTGIAVNRKMKDRDETMFIDIVAFGNVAKILGEYVTKGSPILVEGRLSTNSWEQEGVKRTKHEVMVDTIQLLSSKPRTEATEEKENEDRPF